MQHFFTSGEVLYQQNVKVLEEGRYSAKSISHEGITESTEFISQGVVDDRKAEVRFMLDGAGSEKILFRNTMNILMQSDIIQTSWKSYQLKWLEG